jgi:hypothetical protein
MEWRQMDGERYLPLAAYLLKIYRRKHMGTTRDQFIHEMNFHGGCVLVDPEEADFILFPYRWKPQFAECLTWQRVQNLSAPVVCQYWGKDLLRPESLALPFDHWICLSPMFVRTKCPQHGMGMSYFIPDCAQMFADGVRLLRKSEKPTIGFCGVSAPLRTAWGKTKLIDYIRLFSTYLSRLKVSPETMWRSFGNNTKHAYRTRLIRQFNACPSIECHFVLRQVGGLVDNSYTNKADDDPFNTEFYKNITESLYTICCRGTENYSVRFYETLCMGRIPIVVDTDLVLPFDDRIDYRKHCVWIDQKDISKAAEILLEFHHSRSEEELLAIQQSNRTLWQTHLSHTSYYRQLAEIISPKRH